MTVQPDLCHTCSDTMLVVLTRRLISLSLSLLDFVVFLLIMFKDVMWCHQVNIHASSEQLLLQAGTCVRLYLVKADNLISQQHTI